MWKLYGLQQADQNIVQHSEIANVSEMVFAIYTRNRKGIMKCLKKTSVRGIRRVINGTAMDLCAYFSAIRSDTVTHRDKQNMHS